MKSLGLIWYTDQVFSYPHFDSKTETVKTVEGIRGIITYGLEIWPVIGRAQGYKRLRPGKGSGEQENIFTAIQSTMSWGGLCLRVQDYPGDPDNRMCLHAANKPHQLHGCIAPGLGVMEHGVTASKSAVSQIVERLALKPGELVRIETSNARLGVEMLGNLA